MIQMLQGNQNLLRFCLQKALCVFSVGGDFPNYEEEFYSLKQFGHICSARHVQNKNLDFGHRRKLL